MVAGLIEPVWALTPAVSHHIAVHQLRIGKTLFGCPGSGVAKAQAWTNSCSLLCQVCLGSVGGEYMDASCALLAVGPEPVGHKGAAAQKPAALARAYHWLCACPWLWAWGCNPSPAPSIPASISCFSSGLCPVTDTAFR
jgi:hypothetical protein